VVEGRGIALIRLNLKPVETFVEGDERHKMLV
jgi:hypothetical protein